MNLHNMPTDTEFSHLIYKEDLPNDSYFFIYSKQQDGTAAIIEPKKNCIVLSKTVGILFLHIAEAC